MKKKTTIVAAGLIAALFIFLAFSLINSAAAITVSDTAARPANLETAVLNSYLVYGLPIESPHFASPPPPADGRTTEIAPWLDAPNASPLGWHATTTMSWTNTLGNNVDVHKDAVRYDCGPDLECDPPIDLTMEPTTPGNLDAALVNLFYWTNILHDVTYEYGFDEVAGNFQEDNFGMGGQSGDRLDANAQTVGSCGGGFAVPPDGSPPVMNISTCPLASPARDGALDNGVLAHLYSHGISNRLTGGPLNVSCLSNPEQMGEGWADWLGLMMTIEPGDAGNDLRTLGTWYYGQGPDGPGIRTYPYTTDFDSNPLTYNDIVAAPSPFEVGEVWATMIWDMTWALIDEYGYNPDFYGDWSSGGNNLAMQLVLDGMKLQPCSPGFVDGRDAILIADMVLTGGQNQCLVWQAFARRGLGYSADQGSPNSTIDGSEAFDMPPSCPQLLRSPDIIEATAVLGEVVTGTVIISNTGGISLTFTAVTGAPWAEVSPTGGTLSPTMSLDLLVAMDSGETAGVGTYTTTLTLSSGTGIDPEPVVLVLHVVSQPQPQYGVYMAAVFRE